MCLGHSCIKCNRMRSTASEQFALLIAVTGLAGCSQFAPSEESVASGKAQDIVPVLTGDWLVAAIDGVTVTGVALNGENGRLSWTPACAGWTKRYRIDGNAIRFHVDKPETEAQTVCAIGFPERVPEVFHRLVDMNKVEAIGGTSVRLSGASHNILLERPIPRTKLPVGTLAGRWQVTSLDGRKLSNEPPIFSATDTDLTWEPSCAGSGRSYHIENDRITVRARPASSPPPPPNAQPVTPPPVCAIAPHPQLVAIYAAAEVATHVRPAPGGGVILDGNGHSVTMMPIRPTQKP